MTRLAALAALDALSADDWQTIKPRRVCRQSFRDALEAGRVDPASVLHNIAVAHEVADIEDRLAAALDQLVDMPMRQRASVDMRSVLEVVA